MELYTKTTTGYFPDYADMTKIQIGLFSPPGSAPTTTITKGIVRNPLSWTNSLTGVKNPRWRDQVRNHEDATTAMQASHYKVEANTASMAIRTHVNGGGYNPANFVETRIDGYPYLQFATFGSVPGTTTIRCNNRALAKFISKANSVRTSLEGGQTVGEWSQLVQAVTNPLGALRRFTLDHLTRSQKRLRGFKRPRGKSLDKVVADTYLEWRFGWDPLISDVASGMVGLQNARDQNDIVEISGSAKEDFLGETSTVTDYNYSSASRVYRNVQDCSTLYIRYKGAIRTGAENGIKTWAQTLGLVPERFLPTVWELIPYSFVADYFLNVGKIVESWAFNRSNLVWACKTTRRITVRKYSGQICLPPSSDPDLQVFTASGGDAVLTQKTVQRESLVLLSLVPTLEFHLPVKKRPWINMAALMISKSKPVSSRDHSIQY